MSKGLLGKILSNGSAGQALPAFSSTARFVTFSVDCDNTNTAGSDITIEVFCAVGGSQNPVDRIGMAILSPGSHFEINCKLASPNEQVSIKTNGSGVAVRLTGIEDIPE